MSEGAAPLKTEGLAEQNSNGVVGKTLPTNDAEVKTAAIDDAANPTPQSTYGADIPAVSQDGNDASVQQQAYDPEQATQVVNNVAMDAMQQGQNMNIYSTMMPPAQGYYQMPVMAPGQYPPQPGFLGQLPGPPPTKAKRKRASPHQLALLNQIFEYTFFPSTELRNAVGKELGMLSRTVQIWFQNRRQSWRAQKNRDGSEDPPKTSDNERGGWEVLRSFQARRANGEIQEYDYMALNGPGGISGLHDPRAMSHADGYPVGLHPYQHMVPPAVSSNEQFNASMQPLSGLLPHAPHMGLAASIQQHLQQQQQQQQEQQQQQLQQPHIHPQLQQQGQQELLEEQGINSTAAEPATGVELAIKNEGRPVQQAVE